MRKTIIKGLYLLLTELIAIYLIACPVHAFQVSSSSTGYVRVATASAIAAYQVAHKASFVSAVAAAVSAPTAASVAVRMATGPVGWTLLGVSAAVTLAQMYYSAQEIQATKAAALAAAPTVYTMDNGSGTMLPAGAVWEPSSCVHPCAVNQMQYFYLDVALPPGADCYAAHGTGQYTSPSWPGWLLADNGLSGNVCRTIYTHRNNGSPESTATEMGAMAPTSLTLGEYQTAIAALPSSSPNAVESNTVPVGQGEAVPSAENVTTLQVSPSEIVPTVKPAAQVLPTDAVIDPNAPAPAGPQPVTTPSTTTTTTTTTTTNPDGSTTATQSEEPTVLSCSAGNHDQRTFGSVLQEHLTSWQGTGLLSALNLLKTLSWPSTVPTYTLSSNLFGTFTLDFSAWSGLLTALRSLIIALAAFVAYRIIFVGNP